MTRMSSRSATILWTSARTPARQGGEIVFEGSFAGLLQADTLTGKHLMQRLPIKESFRQPTGQLPIKHARVNNLQQCQCQYSGRGADGGDRRGRIGQELADQRGFSDCPSRGHRGRPVRGGRFDPLQPGHLYRHHGRRSQGLCRRQQGQRRRCSVSTPRAPAKTARAWAWSTST